MQLCPLTVTLFYVATETKNFLNECAFLLSSFCDATKACLSAQHCFKPLDICDAHLLGRLTRVVGSLVRTVPFFDVAPTKGEGFALCLFGGKRCENKVGLNQIQTSTKVSSASHFSTVCFWLGPHQLVWWRRAFQLVQKSRHLKTTTLVS